MLEFPTIGGNLTLETLAEITYRLNRINGYSEDEFQQFIEYTMFLEFTSYTSARDFNFKIHSRNRYVERPEKFMLFLEPLNYAKSCLSFACSLLFLFQLTLIICLKISGFADFLGSVISNEITIIESEYPCQAIPFGYGIKCIWSPEDNSKRNITPYSWIKGVPGIPD